ncbi:MAG: universal stress protein [Bdellovibrionota bacterium]
MQNNEHSDISQSTKKDKRETVSEFSTGLLAVDPSGDGQTLARRHVSEFLAGKNSAIKKLETVSCVFPTDFGWNVDIDLVKTKFIKSLVTNEVHRKMADEGYGELETHIILAPTVSRIAAADMIIETAKKSNAGLIVLGTEAKKGQPTGLGSLAEILVGRSPIPLMIVGQKVLSEHSDKILMPTDFTPASEIAFRKLLAWAKIANSSITLYCQVRFSEMSIFRAYVPGLTPSWAEDAWKAALDNIQKNAANWQTIAANLGVKCETIIEDGAVTLTEGILNKSKELNANLIAFGVARHSWQQIFFGGDLREVFAEAKMPILIFHSELES